MPDAPPLPLPTAALADRLARAEAACIADWMRAARRLPGDPLAADVRTFGPATTTICGRIPAEVFNRVFGLTYADRAAIPAILEWYRARGATPVVDLAPHAVTPAYAGPSLLTELARHGLYQAAFHQLLYGVPAAAEPPLPAHLAIREVGPADAAAVSALYEPVWGRADVMRALLGAPGFRCYLALVDGEPAGLGVLHVADGVGSLANALTIPARRGRGCQTALLHRRLRDAAAAGCDLIASQCRPGSASERNQLRAGLRVVGSKAWWIPSESA